MGLLFLVRCWHILLKYKEHLFLNCIFMKKVIPILVGAGLLVASPSEGYAQRGKGFLSSGPAVAGRKSWRTKKTLSKIGQQYGKHNNGNYIAAQLNKNVTIGTVAAKHLNLQSQPGLITGKWKKGWHAAVTNMLPQEIRADLPLPYAQDILLGNLPLEILSDVEKENLFLSQFPILVLEENWVPTNSQWDYALRYYHSVLFDKLPETEPADELNRWAKKMAAITNLGFFGKLEQGQWIEVAATQQFPLELQPFTDLIVMRALLNIGEESFIDDFVYHRLSAVDKKGRPLKLPAVWNDFPDWVLSYIPEGRIEQPAPPAKKSADQTTLLRRVKNYFQRQKARLVKPKPKPGDEALQYALGRYNSYNILNLDSSPEMTQLYMELQHGMVDKFSDLVFGNSPNLVEQLEYRLSRSYEDAQLFNERQDLPALFPYVSREWIYWDLEGGVEKLYPNAARFLPDELVPLYMLIKHNLEVRKWWPIVQQWQIDVLQATEQLQKIQVPVTHDSSLDIRWLAGQITPQIQHVLVGDTAAAPTFLKDVFELARELRKRYPNRDIVLLSQHGFGLPEGVSDDPEVRRMCKSQHVLKHLVQAEKDGVLAQTVRDQYIQTELLRDPFYENSTGLPTLAAFEEPASLNGAGGRLGQERFAETFEGLRLVSDAYVEQLEALRDKHPDALFIVAADARQVDYAVPYSLGSYLAGPDTYVALLGVQRFSSILDAKSLSLFERNFYPFEMTRVLRSGQFGSNGPEDARFLFDRVLQFKGDVPTGEFGHPVRASWLVGFDVRINRSME